MAKRATIRPERWDRRPTLAALELVDERTGVKILLSPTEAAALARFAARHRDLLESDVTDPGAFTMRTMEF